MSGFMLKVNKLNLVCSSSALQIKFISQLKLILAVDTNTSRRLVNKFNPGMSQKQTLDVISHMTKMWQYWNSGCQKLVQQITYTI